MLADLAVRVADRHFSPWALHPSGFQLRFPRLRLRDRIGTEPVVVLGLMPETITVSLI
jgi:hypothetical protein